MGIAEARIVPHGSLDDLVGVTVITNDDSLRDSVLENDGKRYTATVINGSDFLKLDTAESDAYVLDIRKTFQTVPNLLSKLKERKAINPKTQLIIAATEEQQEDSVIRPLISSEAYFRILTRPKKPGRKDNADRELYKQRLSQFVGGIAPFYDNNMPAGKFEDVTVVKIGGSIFDLYNEEPNALHNLLEQVVRSHEDHRMILTVGGGPTGALAGDLARQYGLALDRSTATSASFLEAQAGIVADMLNKYKLNIATETNPDHLKQILEGGWLTNEMLDERIPVISLLPYSEALGIPNIPANVSDVHTVAFADYIGARRIIFAKNTDGIYKFDPNLPEDRRREAGIAPSSKNAFYRFIGATELPDIIKRKGLNPDYSLTDNHLIETEALEPFSKSNSLVTVQILDGTQPEPLRDALNGVQVGSYILRNGYRGKSQQLE